MWEQLVGDAMIFDEIRRLEHLGAIAIEKEDRDKFKAQAFRLREIWLSASEQANKPKPGIWKRITSCIGFKEKK